MYKILKKELPLKREQVIYIGAALVFLLCFIVYRLIKNSSDVPVFDTPTVTVSKAELGPVVKYVNAIGTLRPFDSVIIKSEVNSTISKIHFSEGAVVEAGDLLLEIEDSSARSALMEAEAQYRKAKSEFDPIDKLAGKGVAAKIQRDTRKAELDVCEARVNSCRSVLQKHKIYAPFKGIVGLKEVSEGQYVAPGNDLVKLVDCYPMKVDFKVAEADIGNVYVDQVVKVLVGGNDFQSYNAKVIAIDPESDKISHSFDVRAILDVPEAATATYQILKPGRFVSVKISLGENQKGVLVPEGAIEKIGEDSMVYKVTNEGIAIRTMVKTGMQRDGNVEIVDGINDGDVVITSGQQSVLDGREVQIQDGDSISNIGGKISEFYKEKLSSSSENKKTTMRDPRKSLEMMEKLLAQKKKMLMEQKNPTEAQKKTLKSLLELEKILIEKREKLRLSETKQKSGDVSSSESKVVKPANNSLQGSVETGSSGGESYKKTSMERDSSLEKSEKSAENSSENEKSEESGRFKDPQLAGDKKDK